MSTTSTLAARDVPEWPGWVFIGGNEAHVRWLHDYAAGRARIARLCDPSRPDDGALAIFYLYEGPGANEERYTGWWLAATFKDLDGKHIKNSSDPRIPMLVQKFDTWQRGHVDFREVARLTEARRAKIEADRFRDQFARPVAELAVHREKRRQGIKDRAFIASKE